MKGPFDYSVPEELGGSLDIGKRVWVEFGSKKMVGYAVGFADATDIKKIKPIISVIDKDAIFDKFSLELAEEMSRYYMCSLGEAIEAMVPACLKKGRTEVRMRGEFFPDMYESVDEHISTSHQKKVLEPILDAIDNKRHEVFLLHGITGSGKTEVYMKSISRLLALHRSAIILVPEISLTPQAEERFKSRFGDNVAILHSRLRGSQHFAEWKRIMDGTAKVVVGARSAIFSPVKDLGLIIIDEEHETTYKQQEVPRYHAREVALMRARMSAAALILGSATPSLESYYMAVTKKYRLIELPERVSERSLPPVEIVDMRDEAWIGGRMPVLSKSLECAINDTLKAEQQVILFLNRRGFATFINCRKCGLHLKCKRCASALTYHYAKKAAICHWCGYSAEPPAICPECNSSYISFFGAGTEKIESEIARLFPKARYARMDTDATKAKGSHKIILDKFKRRDIDILIGTQMIAKGLDFPGAGLVGVVSADTALHIPDFRSNERTFDLLTQVAGRAGRGKHPGRVIIQTYAPHHYSIISAKSHDYKSFYDHEMPSREELNLPPYTHIVELVVRGRNEGMVKDASKRLTEALSSRINGDSVYIAGPAPMPTSRLRGRYRWHIVLKSKKPENIALILKSSLAACRLPSSVDTIIDVDPL
ncbi:MAG: primosomal protein N' [Candidatus Omnitrophica bacterium CG1_02_49_10]|nr:MAG: primosomal protein N' [Candidatus Omnitrophica bacterium CG1_02_49_10]